MEESDIKRWEQLTEKIAEDKKRAQRIEDISCWLEAPKGIFQKRCPTCNAKLLKQTYHVGLPPYASRLLYYRCGNCEYEYAKVSF